MLAFDREGQGAPTFVFVHGFGCAREDWSAQVAAFSGSHNCMSLDLPGFGDSPALGELPSMAGFGEAVLELMDAFSELDEPRPIQGEMSVDPMAEAWLKELMRLIVREGGRTALATEMIEEVASAKLGGRTGAELSVWLESLFAAGKLVKIHGGDTTGWGPSPRWLG